MERQTAVVQDARGLVSQAVPHVVEGAAVDSPVEFPCPWCYRRFGMSWPSSTRPCSCSGFSDVLRSYWIRMSGSGAAGALCRTSLGFAHDGQRAYSWSASRSGKAGTLDHSGHRRASEELRAVMASELLPAEGREETVCHGAGAAVSGMPRRPSAAG